MTPLHLRYGSHALFLAALIAQGDVLALGADAPRAPAPAPAASVDATAAAISHDKPATIAKAKPKPAPRRTATTSAPADRCPAAARTEFFEPGRVYRLQTRRGYASEIRLGIGDTISDNPLGGDVDFWDVYSPLGTNVVTVKPKEKANPSNLILRTQGRSYLIALEVLPNLSPCRGEWQLTFQVPPPPVVLAPEPPELIAAREARALSDAAKAVPAGRNWSYTMQALPDSNDIMPTEVFDDGRFTYIRIPGNRELPSVFLISADGTESFVERHMEGRDLMVIHEVARQWVLRLDKQTIGLWNEAFDIEGVPPVAGARSDQVRRVIRTGGTPR